MNIKFKHIILIFLSIFCLCSACSEDFSDRLEQEEGNKLYVYVPSARNLASRSSVDESEELKYSSLIFFAFPTDENKQPTIITLNNDNSSLSYIDSFTSYPIELEQGDYYLYICANIYDADIDISTLPQTVDELKEAIYNIPADFQCGIPNKGLPMSASHTDFFVKNSDGSQHSMDSSPFHYDGNGGNIYSLLTFLYAKITVNSYDALGNLITPADIKVSNISEREPVIFNADYEDYGSADIEITVSEENDESHTTPKNLTLYIPEKYVSEANLVSQSSLSFRIGEKQITLPLGEIDGIDESISNSVPDASSLRKIVRGTHYTYTLNTNINLEVSSWSPVEIASKLSGPVYLHIEKQEYEVKAGSKTAIWFSSDAETVRVSSPKYTTSSGSTLDLYKYSIDADNDTIRVWVNPDIKSTEYETIKESINKNEGKYDFFHIVAGPINKLIKVTPLTLDYFLNVTPTTVPINVGLRIGSSEYSGSIPVSINTNFPNVQVSLRKETGWSDITNEALTITNPEGVVIAEGTPDERTVESVDVINYNVNFRDLNSGNEIWKEEKVLTFDVTGKDPNGIEKTTSVKVVITPMMLNYKIHFKSAVQSWSHPHIYVYQCLEFPADWPGTYTPSQEVSPISLASKPIGYRDGSNFLAALEYSFTGAVAFRGWDYPANQNELYSPTGVTRPFDGYFAQGFYIFSNGSNTWDVSKTTVANIRYSYDMDFCEEHREEIVSTCPYCKWDTSTMNRLWPGIMMKPEGDGWYEFELTGIANPGRTLIMFASGHSGLDTFKDTDFFTKYQFPGSYSGASVVGVPLFDFPSKEGWLLYNGNMEDRINNQFSSTKPTN